MKITILAVGKMRGADAELCEEYKKRLKGPLSVREIAAPAPKAESEALLKAVAAKAFLVVCDERGKDLSSRELAEQFAAWQSRAELIFVIGGADGVSDALRTRADFILSLGRKTWPHRLARIMLLEQLYRVQQINAGHPYHRD